jgi:ankyrin repeat protein
MFYYKYLDILKPKSKENIINELNNLSQHKRNKILFEASYKGQIDIVKLLIETGADINAKNYNGYESTPLMYALVAEHLEVVKLLIKAGANVNAKNIWGETALFLASRKGYEDIIKILIEVGAY